MPAAPSPYRFYRNVVMAVWLALTLLFLWQVTISVWRDLYGTRTTQALDGNPTVTDCVQELESMNREIEARMSVVPRGSGDLTKAEADWDLFEKKFEYRLRHAQMHCVDEDVPGADEAVRSAMRASVENLDSLRQNLARCGLEGEGQRDAVASSLQQLRIAAKPAHP